MRQFMRDEFAALVCLRRISSGRENNVGSGSICVGVQRLSGPRCGVIGVNAHTAEVLMEPLLHRIADCGIERVPRRAEYILHKLERAGLDTMCDSLTLDAGVRVD